MPQRNGSPEIVWPSRPAGLKKVKAIAPLALAQHVEREGLRLLDERVGVRVRLDAHHHERRGEGGLRHPVHGGRRHASSLPLAVST